MSSGPGAVVVKLRFFPANLRGDGHREAHVPLGADLRHVHLAVTDQDLRGLRAELTPDARRVVVPELVWVPVAGLLLLGQSLVILPEISSSRLAGGLGGGKAWPHARVMARR